MALQRRSPLVATSLSCIFLFLLFSVVGPTTAGKTGQLTVYWGRNKTEGSLREACDTGLYTTVIISFFSVFGHGKYWTDLAGHDASAVGADVKHCQSKHILVLLSIGGDGGGQYSLPTARSARDVADHLWDAYLGGGRRGVFRPFGDAVLDGIDFYLDIRGMQDRHYGELARSLASRQRRCRCGKVVRLTASPPCAAVFDAEQQPLSALEKTGLLERLHVRFYGDGTCGYDYHELRPFWGAWNQWSSSRTTATQLHLGLAAADEFRGWIDPETLRESVLPSVQDKPKYSGVVIWNRYYDKQTGFGRAIRDAV